MPPYWVLHQWFGKTVKAAFKAALSAYYMELSFTFVLFPVLVNIFLT